MDELRPIDKKICSFCKEVKPLTSFHKNKNHASGRTYNCKECNLINRRKYYLGGGYIKSREYQRKKSQLPEEKKRIKEAQKKYRLTNSMKIHARSCICISLRSGYIKKPELCEICKSKSVLSSHHWHGYAPDKWLDILWLCDKCHILAHEYTPKKNL